MRSDILPGKKISCLILLLLGLFLAGCGPVGLYRVQVTGYTQPDATPPPPPPAAFHVLDNLEAKDLALSRQIKGKIEKILGIKGYIVTSFEQADYYLVFAYGQGQEPGPAYPPRVYPYYPGFGQPYRMALPYYYGPGPPALYDRWLLVNVVEGPRFRAKKEFQRVWQGEARSTGISPNMAATVNYLLVALFEDFGKSTGVGRVVEISEEDFRAYELIR